MFGVQAEGREITTVEGMLTGGALDPIQEAFKQEHGLQCGFCTPGMMLVARALLEENADPTDDEVRWAISGNVCRCTGYMNIVKAVRSAARMRAGAGDGSAGLGPEEPAPADEIAEGGVTAAAPSA